MDFLQHRSLQSEREQREREYAYQVTVNCLSAIEFLADAGRAPRVSKSSIRHAQKAIAMAAHYAELLDPTEEEEYEYAPSREADHWLEDQADGRP